MKDRKKEDESAFVPMFHKHHVLHGHLLLKAAKKP